MDVMRDHVDLFWNQLDDEVAAEEAPEAVAEAKRAVGAIAMQVDRAVAAEAHHAVDEAEDRQPPIEVERKEDHEIAKRRNAEER